MHVTDSHDGKLMTSRAAAREHITVVAHDLRNYITPLQGRLDMMRPRALREGRSDYVHDSEHAARSLNRLRRLIDDLLDASRLERGLIQLEPRLIDVQALVCETVEAFISEQTAIEVVAPRRAMAYADPDRLQQAIENLLANAVAHSPPGTAIRVDVYSLVRDLQRWVEVRVTDRGPGVPAALIPHLFECFSTGLHSTGLGLGLFLVRGITNAHGGTVSIDSKSGQGSTFTLTWPAGTPPETTHGSAAPSPRKTADHRARSCR